RARLPTRRWPAGRPRAAAGAQLSRPATRSPSCQTPPPQPQSPYRDPAAARSNACVAEPRSHGSTGGRTGGWARTRHPQVTALLVGCPREYNTDFASCCGPHGRSPSRAFDTGLRPDTLPDQAASLLPGLLTATRTGLRPASYDELTTTDHLHKVTSSLQAARNRQVKRDHDACGDTRPT